MTHAISQYLQRYSEAETQLIPAALLNRSSTWQLCLTMPCFKENPQKLIDKIQQYASHQQQLLFILVLNHPADQPCPQEHHELIQGLNQTFSVDVSNQHLATYTITDGSHLLLVDRSVLGSPLDKKQAVGLARKIGLDIALQLYHQGLVDSPWLMSSDADACIEAHHFEAVRSIAPDSGASAHLFQYSHGDVDTNTIAMRLYDFSLSYYQQGLAWAGSAYAHQSLGSIINVNALSYAKARGMPKRAAGEDFYLLNKLRKLGPITTLETQALKLEARESDRVPFGTGPALLKIKQLDNPINHYHFYAFEIFVELKKTLAVLGSYSSPQTLDNYRQQLSTKSLAALNSQSILSKIESGLSRCKTEAQYQQHFINVFDAFQTLKFIHYLRDHYYPSISLDSLMSEIQQSQPSFYNECQLLVAKLGLDS